MKTKQKNGQRYASRPLFTHERLTRLFLGISILMGLGTGYLITPWGYLILLGIALNLIQYSFTGYCQVKNLMDNCGVLYEKPPEHLICETRAGIEGDDHVYSKS